METQHTMWVRNESTKPLGTITRSVADLQYRKIRCSTIGGLILSDGQQVR